MGPFADTIDVETALVRPLTDAEAPFVVQLIGQASALLRTAVPAVDDLIKSNAADPSGRAGVSGDTVAVVTAGVVKRYMVNPQGLASVSNQLADLRVSNTYAIRGEIAPRGVLQILPSDIDILFPNRKRNRVGSIRLRAALAPRPVGRYGPIPTIREAITAVITFGDGQVPNAELITAEYIGADPMGTW